MDEEIQKLKNTIHELSRENDNLRASLANGNAPCVYCNLPKDEWAKCSSGFPGCGRADDAMLCPHVGISLDTEFELNELKSLTQVGEWSKLVDEIAKQYELAATFNQSHRMNTEGCAAIAKLMRSMAHKLDIAFKLLGGGNTLDIDA